MTKILPNQTLAHLTAGAAWHYAKMLIENHGDLVRTEDGKLTKEICNLQLTIMNPLEGWPIRGSGWDMTGLNKYAEQLMNPENPGFCYTYGNRLRSYPDDQDDTFCEGCTDSDGFEAGHTDQIIYVIDKLKESPNTRRAIAITWCPDIDIWKDHVPCLQLLDFLIRGGMLQCAAVFRSHDIGRAFVPNVYGIAKLMQHVAGKVGAPAGSLTTVSCSAHVYEA